MKLDQYLSEHDLTDTAFAALIGRTQSSVSRLRRSETRPDWETLERIQAATNGAVTPNDFLPEAHDEPADKSKENGRAA